MTKPKFANTSVSATPRRPKTESTEVSEEVLSVEVPERHTSSGVSLPSIVEFMSQHMVANEKEPTRPITLRFEESLWQKVEKYRGNLTKNDFFKYLLDYFEKSQFHKIDSQNPN